MLPTILLGYSTHSVPMSPQFLKCQTQQNCLISMIEKIYTSCNFDSYLNDSLLRTMNSDSSKFNFNGHIVYGEVRRGERDTNLHFVLFKTKIVKRLYMFF